MKSFKGTTSVGTLLVGEKYDNLKFSYDKKKMCKNMRSFKSTTSVDILLAGKKI